VQNRTSFIMFIQIKRTSASLTAWYISAFYTPGYFKLFNYQSAQNDLQKPATFSWKLHIWKWPPTTSDVLYLQNLCMKNAANYFCSAESSQSSVTI